MVLNLGAPCRARVLEPWQPIPEIVTAGTHPHATAISSSVSGALIA